MSQLSDILKGGPQGGMTRVSDNIAPVTRTLPNGGGTYQAPIFKVPTVIPPAQPDIPKEYIKPDGTYYTAKEVVANRVSKMNSPDISRYAGDTVTSPNASTADLNRIEAGLNNARNDIATGATDPYGTNSQPGIVYSPKEREAIQKAYAGIYDPALTDVHTKLQARQKEDAAKLAAQQRKDEIVFNTNENIRQWRATTGTKAGSSGSDMFTPTQIHKGASNAGVEIDSFDTLDNDVKNYFINPPSTVDEVSGKTVKKTTIFDNLMKEIESGDRSHDEVAQLITDSESLPQAVKTYYINHLPLDPAKKEGYFSKIWSAITGQ